MTYLIRQIGVGVGVLSLLGAPIHASAEERYLIEEMVVTAQKRSELLQEVPVAVTALSGQALQDMGAQGFMDYARFLPSLSMLTRGDGNSTMQVRGVSPPGFGTQATTAIYFDEIPVGSQFGQPDLPLVDIDRVELLRGPQGTLFGEGSIGGTLRLISNKPQLNEFTFSVTGEASQTSGGGDNFGTSAVVNVPLGDYAALRASGSVRNLDGWIDSVGTRAQPAEKVGGIARTNFENINSREISTARVVLMVAPTDRLTVDLAYSLTSIDGDDVDVDLNDAARLSPGFQPNVTLAGKNKGDWAVRNYRYDDYEQVSLTLEYDLGWGVITSATGRFDRSLDELGEQPGYAFFVDANSWSFYTQDDKYFSHETRIASTSDGPLEWVAGIFYRDREVKAASDIQTTYILDMVEAGNYFGNEIPSLRNQTQLLRIFTLPSKTTFEHKAIFASATYAFSDQLDVTVGLRYFEEDQSSDAVSAIMNFAAVPALVVEAAATGQPLVPPFTQRAATSFKTTDSAVSPRFNVRYKFNEDWMMYATAAEGFRAGGVNRNPATDFLTGDPLPGFQSFESDSLWSYEIGSKNTFNDGRLTVNSAVFFIQWDDIQVPGVIDGVQQRWITNAGSAEIKGAEVEIALMPAPGWYLNAFASYNDAELSESAVNQPSGTRLPQVAEWKYGVAAQYEFPITNGLQGRVRADYSYLDEQPAILSANSPMVPDYAIVNLRGVIEASTWSLELFVDNVTNEYASLGFDAGYLGNFRNRPRTAGLRLSADLK
ncbi:MAG: TonB-dependent receptor [Pseudomonadales bacterium]